MVRFIHVIDVIFIIMRLSCDVMPMADRQPSRDGKNHIKNRVDDKKLTDLLSSHNYLVRVVCTCVHHSLSYARMSYHVMSSCYYEMI